jgi:hypothetical protein
LVGAGQFYRSKIEQNRGEAHVKIRVSVLGLNSNYFLCGLISSGCFRITSIAVHGSSQACHEPLILQAAIRILNSTTPPQLFENCNKNN